MNTAKVILYFPLLINILLWIFILIIGIVPSSSQTIFTMDIWTIILSILILVGVLALIGIGSMFFQFSDSSVRIFISLGIYIGIWTLFSLTTWNYMSQIPFGLGHIIMSILSGSYLFGCVLTMTHGGET